MTDTLATPVEAPAADIAVNHLVCCEVEAGHPTRTLCGAVDPGWDGSYWDDCPPPDRCVVCDHLDRVDHCPDRPDHRCPYGRD